MNCFFGIIGTCDFMSSSSSSIIIVFSSDLVLGFFFRIVVFFVLIAAVSSSLLPRLNFVVYSSVISVSDSISGCCFVSCFV